MKTKTKQKKIYAGDWNSLGEVMEDEKIKQEFLKELPMLYYEELGFWSVKKGYGEEIRLDDRFVKKILKTISKIIEKINKQGEGVVSISPKLDVRIHAKPLVEIEKNARHLALKEVFDKLEKLDGGEVWTRDDILKILKKHFGVD